MIPFDIYLPNNRAKNPIIDCHQQVNHVQLGATDAGVKGGVALPPLVFVFTLFVGNTGTRGV
jgi:hypothetical protein